MKKYKIYIVQKLFKNKQKRYNVRAGGLFFKNPAGNPDPSIDPDRGAPGGPGGNGLPDAFGAAGLDTAAPGAAKEYSEMEGNKLYLQKKKKKK